jgi:hypothetical protein
MSTPFDAITTTGTTAIAHKPAAVLPAGLVRAASERQLELLKSLMVEKCERTTGQVTTADLASIDAWLASGPTRDQASENITRLIGESKAARQQAPATDKVSESRSTGMPREDVVPAGRYAVATNDGAVNELAFYKVDRPTEDRGGRCRGRQRHLRPAHRRVRRLRAHAHQRRQPGAGHRPEVRREPRLVIASRTNQEDTP